MRVFVTGASGWIGSATVDELLAGGHEVLGLVRSDAAVERVAAKGATVLRGDLDDLDSLRSGAADSDAVVHLANKHDWANPAESNRAERAAVQTLADALAGTDRPFIVAAGLAGIAGTEDGSAALENGANLAVGPDSPRGGAENLALEYVARGVRTIIVRFAPTVHGTHDHGFVSYLVGGARESGAASYVGDGDNRWAAVHVSDAARLVRLGLEQAPAGTKLHAVAEQGVRFRDIAAAIGARYDLPVESVAAGDAEARFGFLARFAALDMPASSELTRGLLGWTPSGPTLVADIEAGAYDS